MAKKTIKVIELINKANSMLQKSTCDPEGRLGIMTLLESVLSDTGNHRGFRYLRETEVPEGHKAGIYYVNGEPDCNNTDRTRVKYYIHTRLMD